MPSLLQRCCQPVARLFMISGGCQLLSFSASEYLEFCQQPNSHTSTTTITLARRTSALFFLWKGINDYTSSQAFLSSGRQGIALKMKRRLEANFTFSAVPQLSSLPLKTYSNKSATMAPLSTAKPSILPEYLTQRIPTHHTCIKKSTSSSRVGEVMTLALHQGWRSLRVSLGGVTEWTQSAAFCCHQTTL